VEEGILGEDGEGYLMNGARGGGAT